MPASYAGVTYDTADRPSDLPLLGITIHDTEETLDNTIATFWNDITMGAAWASCIDIGRRYSGIVSGCMNTVGNLGGAVAGYATGWVLKTYQHDHHLAWQINFASYGAVYVLAVLFWLCFDSTKPVVQEEH